MVSLAMRTEERSDLAFKEILKSAFHLNSCMTGKHYFKDPRMYIEHLRFPSNIALFFFKGSRLLVQSCELQPWND